VFLGSHDMFVCNMGGGSLMGSHAIAQYAFSYYIQPFYTCSQSTNRSIFVQPAFSFVFVSQWVSIGKHRYSRAERRIFASNSVAQPSQREAVLWQVYTPSSRLS
jgi:hypothetical protein